MTQYITRVAPSPTGFPHLATARVAYHNWLAARATGGQFILRIDDTDRDREVPGAVDAIHEALNWLDLKPDLTFHQSDRLDRYRAVAESLLSQGLARHAENGAVLLNGVDPIPWTDWLSGTMVPSESQNEIARDQVLIRGNGMPIFHFASVVDDIDYGVNLIIRGIDHFDNTFRHTAIYNALNAKVPEFAHVGLMMHQKKKLSKRDAAASLDQYRENHPEALLAFLLRLGWAPREDNKANAVIDRHRALQMFLTEGSLRSSPASMDFAKLNWFNRKVAA